MMPQKPSSLSSFTDARKADAKRLLARFFSKQGASTGAYFFLYGCTSIGLTLSNKSLATILPYAWSTLFIQNLGALFSSLVLLSRPFLTSSSTSTSGPSPVKPFRRTHFLPSLLNAVWFIAMLWSSLKALQFISVPLYVAACNARPLASAFIELVFLGRTLPMPAIGGLILILSGATFYAFQDPSATYDGVWYAVMNTLLVGGLGVYENTLMTKLKTEQTALGLNLYRLVLSSPFVGIMIYLYEWERLLTLLPGLYVSQPWLLLWLTVLLAGTSVLALLMGVLMFTLQGRVSATSISVFNTLTKFGTSLASVCVHGAQVTLAGWVGYGVCSCGFYLFSTQKGGRRRDGERD